MKKIIAPLLSIIFLFTANENSQTINWKQFTPNNSGYPSRYNKSIAFIGDSLLVPSNKITIFEISKGNWKTLWFDLPVGSYIDIDTYRHVWFMDNHWSNEVRLEEYDWKNPKTFSYPRVKGGEHLLSFGIDGLNNKWISSDDEGVYQFNESGWMKYDTTNSGILSNFCTQLFINKVKNEVWVFSVKWNPTRGAMSKYDGTKWTNYFLKDIGFQTDEWSPYAAFDKNGNTWLSHEGKVFYFNGTTWQEIKNTFSNENNFGSIGIDKNNNKWFTFYYANGTYLLKYDDILWSKYPIGFGADGSIMFDKYDQKWFINDYGLVVFKENGLISDIEEKSKLPETFNLKQNFPNPFNPSTKISYELPKNTFVFLEIYNLLGEKVTTLVNEEKSAGSYNIQFNASGLSSGIYFYTLRTNEFVQTKKMILLR